MGFSDGIAHASCQIIERPGEIYSYAALDQQTGEIPLRLSEGGALVALCRRPGWRSTRTRPQRQICGSASVRATASIDPAIGLNVDWAASPNIHAQGAPERSYLGTPSDAPEQRRTARSGAAAAASDNPTASRATPGPAARSRPPSLHNTSFILHMSGTTGHAKGVRLTGDAVGRGADHRPLRARRPPVRRTCVPVTVAAPAALPTSGA